MKRKMEKNEEENPMRITVTLLNSIPHNSVVCDTEINPFIHDTQEL